VVGGLTVLLGLYAWALEPATAPEQPDENHDPEGPASTEVATVG